MPAAESAVVGLIDVINRLGLARGAANDLRNKAGDVGTQAATGGSGACKKLDGILRAGRTGNAVTAGGTDGLRERGAGAARVLSAAGLLRPTGRQRREP